MCSLRYFTMLKILQSFTVKCSGYLLLDHHTLLLCLTIFRFSLLSICTDACDKQLPRVVWRVHISSRKMERIEDEKVTITSSFELALLHVRHYLHVYSFHCLVLNWVFPEELGAALFCSVLVLPLKWFAWYLWATGWQLCNFPFWQEICAFHDVPKREFEKGLACNKSELECFSFLL